MLASRFGRGLRQRVDPGEGRKRFADYAWQWLEDRHNLRPRTRELYASVLNRHLVPAFGHLELVQITTANVRTWHTGLARTSSSSAIKCYRLPSTILSTAVGDRMLVANPCTIKGAGQEHHPERPVRASVSRGVLQGVSAGYSRDRPAERAASRSGPGHLPGQMMERATRIELAFSAWEADVLPLNYARELLSD